MFSHAEYSLAIHRFHARGICTSFIAATFFCNGLSSYRHELNILYMKRIFKIYRSGVLSRQRSNGHFEILRV